MEILSKAEIIEGKIKKNSIELKIRITEVDGNEVDPEARENVEISLDLKKLSIIAMEKQSGRPIEITYCRNNPTASIKVSGE